MKGRVGKGGVVRLLLVCLLAVSVRGMTGSAAPAANVSQAGESIGWHRTGNNYYYVLPGGNRAQGWRIIGGQTYYFNRKGYRVTGWKKIEGNIYYFLKTGARKTGWLRTGGKRYYLDPARGGARCTGMKVIGRGIYMFSRKGVMRTGWVKYQGNRYYFRKNGRRAAGWVAVNGKTYYLDPATGIRVTGRKTIGGSDYVFSSKGVLLSKIMSKEGKWVGPDGNALYPSTIKHLLRTALQPVGSTMYVWGGGWNLSQTGGDITSRTIGVSPQWRRFFAQQSSAYDYTTTRYQIKNGLDCSGYVGWVIYNTFNRVSGRAGYVMLAQVQAKTFASYGWGSYTYASLVRDFKAGDVMSTAGGHVYIVVGQCSDGSVVLLHSSPKGVMLSGTYTKAGKKKSQAVKLAASYMKRYYPEWYKKYPQVARDASYLKRYDQMRWYTTSGSIMSDPDGYRGKSAAQVLSDLFS